MYNCAKMSIEFTKNYLPVPEITDEILQHSTKQGRNNDSFRVKKPPKIPKHDFLVLNRTPNTSSAHAISFRESSEINKQILSPFYNKQRSESYFEQCFDTVAKIGEGSFGEVFKVRSKEDGLLYAVKKSKQFFRSEHYRQERLEEVKRYEQFSNHEHCVTLYKAWEQDEILYMQMELCDGSLENYLAKKGHIPEPKVWSILLDLLLALKSLHDRNLIHLDIKLDNILIGDDGRCKLGDFGLVFDVDKANKCQATEGDSRYMAPELMQGHFSKAADIFSLGIAVLELSCNLELPSNGALWQQLRSGILPEDFIKKLSPELREVIKKMMAPSQFQRPTVDEILSNRKLGSILQSRKRWKIFKKFKQSYRKAKRLVWVKLCNLKNIIYSFFLYITTRLKTKETTVHQCERSPHSQQHSPHPNFYDSTTKIVNSTPLNHSGTNLRRLRKDLTRTSLFWCDNIGPPDDLNSSLDDPGLNKSYSSNGDTSASICKKLFPE